MSGRGDIAEADAQVDYGADYYASHCGPIPYDRNHPHWIEFFGKIADQIIQVFRPRRVFDAGCAHGFLVEALWDRGVEAWGRDISAFAISKARPDIRQYCSVGSLADPIEGSFDLVVCIEVLEHMTEADAMLAIANMTAASDRVALSSSPDDFTEPTHINVRPPIYWIKAFASHRYVPLIEASLPSITPHTLVFERREMSPSDEYLTACLQVVRGRVRTANDYHRLGAVSAQVARLQKELETLRTSVRHSDEVIRIARDEGSLARQMSDEASAEQTRLREALSRQHDELTRLREALTRQRDEMARLRVTYETIIQSTTWRLTAPLRMVVRLMPTSARRRLRQLLKLIYWSATFQLRARLNDRRRARGRWLTNDLSSGMATDRPADFDADYYLRANPDVAAAGIDPLEHYLRSGRTEDRYPNALAARAMIDLRLKDLCNPDDDEPGGRIADEAFRVSALTPTYNTPPRYLRELFQTLLNQQYANWEWVIVDDGSSNPATLTTLREIAEVDPRVRLIVNSENRGISAASNVAVSAAQGTHAALIDHDDLVSREAFLKIYEAWKKAPNTDLFYTDECKLLPDGTIEQFWVKPDWSPAYLECTMSLGHLSVYEIDFLHSLGGFRSDYDGTQDYDLALRASLTRPLVQHLPFFAYLWRITPGSAATNLSEKQYAIERQRKAVLAYACHKHPGASVVSGWDLGYWRIVYPLADPAPLLSYVIPTGGGSRSIHGELIDLVTNCVCSFEAEQFYPSREYIVVHNGNLTDEQVCKLETVPNVRLVHYDAPVFNLSEKINLGVSMAQGEFLCLLNDDVAAITSRGGEELVSYLAANPQVGCVGPLCLREDETIQQNGVVLLGKIGPAHAGDGRQANFGGHQSILHCRRESFCIGGAVMFVRTDTFRSVGGFSEDLPLNYNDVDFCQRLREKGLTCIVDPGVRVYHYEGATKIGTSQVEQERFFLRHPGVTDPYFSRWFNQGNPNYELDFRPDNRRCGFGPWFDHHIAQRAAALIPQGHLVLSVCVSVYNQPKRLLEEMYTSVLMQTYQNVEFLVLDNGSSNPETLEWLQRAHHEGRANILHTDVNLGISGANLKLLATLTGDFFVALDADDFLSVDALQIMAHAIEQHPTKKIFYSDEYKSDMNSTRFQPFFKPDFDPILLMNCCYPAHLMAMNADYLRKIGSYTDDETTWCHDYDTLARALAHGEEPVHVRELIYAWRINPGSTASAETSAKPGTVKSQKVALTRLLRARSLEHVLSIEPKTIESSTGMWSLRAAQPIPNVRPLSVTEVWGGQGMGVAGLASLAAQPEVEWIAILMASDQSSTLPELSAAAWFDPRTVVVGGIHSSPDGIIQWSGGLFLPRGRIFDPYVGRPFSDGGYHGQLWCQRCVDVSSPVNVLIRADVLIRAANRPGVCDADSLMTILGLAAQERGELVVVTPHVRVPLPPTSLVSLPLDRASLLVGAAALERGSRWYDGRLATDTPYAMPDW